MGPVARFRSNAPACGWESNPAKLPLPSLVDDDARVGSDSNRRSAVVPTAALVRLSYRPRIFPPGPIDHATTVSWRFGPHPRGPDGACSLGTLPGGNLNGVFYPLRVSLRAPAEA